MLLEQIALIDEVVETSDGLDAITCRSRLPMQSPVFEGHFPGFATLPGVLMIEMMAQAAGYLTFRRVQVKKMPVLVAVDDARFKSFARPGEELTAQARLVHDGAGYVVFKTTLHRAGDLLAGAQIRLRLIEFVTNEMREHITAMAQRHGLIDAPTAAKVGELVS